MNPYDPVTQPKEWAAWERSNAPAPKGETPKPETPPANSATLPGTAAKPPAYTPSASRDFVGEKAATPLAGGGLR